MIVAEIPATWWWCYAWYVQRIPRATEDEALKVWYTQERWSGDGKIGCSYTLDKILCRHGFLISLLNFLDFHRQKHWGKKECRMPIVGIHVSYKKDYKSNPRIRYLWWEGWPPDSKVRLAHRILGISDIELHIKVDGN